MSPQGPCPVAATMGMSLGLPVHVVVLGAGGGGGGGGRGRRPCSQETGGVFGYWWGWDYSHGGCFCSAKLLGFPGLCSYQGIPNTTHTPSPQNMQCSCPPPGKLLEHRESPRTVIRSRKKGRPKKGKDSVSRHLVLWQENGYLGQGTDARRTRGRRDSAPSIGIRREEARKSQGSGYVIEVLSQRQEDKFLKHSGAGADAQTAWEQGRNPHAQGWGQRRNAPSRTGNVLKVSA